MSSARSLSIVSLLLMLPTAAASDLVLFDIDETQPSLTATLDAVGVSDSDSLDLRGFILADVTVTNDATFGDIVTSIEFLRSGVLFSDMSFTLFQINLVDLLAVSSGLRDSLVGPALTATGTAPGTSTFVLDGSTLTLEVGTFEATGTILAVPTTLFVDMSVTPLVFSPAIGQSATAVVGSGGEIEINIPFVGLSGVVLTSPAVTTLTIDGTLVIDSRTSVPAVPMPALFVTVSCLLGLGAYALRARRRRLS